MLVRAALMMAVLVGSLSACGGEDEAAQALAWAAEACPKSSEPSEPFGSANDTWSPEEFYADMNEAADFAARAANADDQYDDLATAISRMADGFRVTMAQNPGADTDAVIGYFGQQYLDLVSEWNAQCRRVTVQISPTPTT